MALGTYGPLFDKAMSNVVEVKARGASVLALTTESRREEMAKNADAMMVIPDTEDMFLPSLGVCRSSCLRTMLRSSAAATLISPGIWPRA